MGLTMRCWHDWLYQEMVGCTWQTIQNFYRQKKHIIFLDNSLCQMHTDNVPLSAWNFHLHFFKMFIILISQFFWLKLPFLVVDAPHSWLPKNIAQARPDPAGASVLKFKPQRMKRRLELKFFPEGGGVKVGIVGWDRCLFFPHWTVWVSQSELQSGGCDPWNGFWTAEPFERKVI